MTGTTRSISTCTGVCSEKRSDSPPTSTTSAPIWARRNPCATARSVPAVAPPSLNESGLALTMPTRRPRAQSIAPPAWIHTEIGGAHPTARARRRSDPPVHRARQPTGAHLEGRTLELIPAVVSAVSAAAATSAVGVGADPEQHRRAGAGDGRAQAALAVHQPADGVDAGHQRAAVGLVQEVLEQRGQVVEAVLAQRERQADGARERGARRRPARPSPGSAVRASSVLVRQSGMTAMKPSPSGSGTCWAHGPGHHGHQAPVEAGGGVVGVALDLGGPREQVVGRPAQPAERVGGDQARADGGRRRAEAAAQRDAVLALDRQAVERSEAAREGHGTPGWSRPRAPRRRPRR